MSLLAGWSLGCSQTRQSGGIKPQYAGTASAAAPGGLQFALRDSQFWAGSWLIFNSILVTTCLWLMLEMVYLQDRGVCSEYTRKSRFSGQRKRQSVFTYPRVNIDTSGVICEEQLNPKRPCTVGIRKGALLLPCYSKQCT
jgi:hypothetical protein